jgi:hypothetical protein
MNQATEQANNNVQNPNNPMNMMQQIPPQFRAQFIANRQAQMQQLAQMQMGRPHFNNDIQAAAAFQALQNGQQIHRMNQQGVRVYYFYISN